MKQRDGIPTTEPVSLRGFERFNLEHRAEKPARIITETVSELVSGHNVPFFKPYPDFEIVVK